LLFGPYRAPALRRGDRAYCLYRDAAVVVCGWTYAPAPWPRCYQVGRRGTGRGLLVEEGLARAVRHESAAAGAGGEVEGSQNRPARPFVLGGALLSLGAGLGVPY
jgi:hypothetical protein